MYCLVGETMSKIGRKPIELHSVKIDVQGQEVHYKGSHAAGVHIVPDQLTINITDKTIQLLAKRMDRNSKRLWGLHRALLAAKIGGANKLFERQVRITGLGYKAVPSTKAVEFSLGFSHKINFDLPEGVSVETDKSGQIVTVKSANKELLGQVCGKFRLLKPTEPYKGTGIQVEGDVIIRKAGKAKA